MVLRLVQLDGPNARTRVAAMQDEGPAWVVRRPRAVHVHYLGAAVLSFSQGVRTAPGEVFEIEADAFRLPLRNPLGSTPGSPVTVRAL